MSCFGLAFWAKIIFDIFFHNDFSRHTNGGVLNFMIYDFLAHKDIPFLHRKHGKIMESNPVKRNKTPKIHADLTHGERNRMTT